MFTVFLCQLHNASPQRLCKRKNLDATTAMLVVLKIYLFKTLKSFM